MYCEGTVVKTIHSHFITDQDRKKEEEKGVQSAQKLHLRIFYGQAPHPRPTLKNESRFHTLDLN